MPEQHIHIAMPQGKADAYLFTPENNEAGLPLPGIIDYPDIKSVRETSREMSQRVANEGYLVLSPNVFYRYGPPPVFDDVPWDFSNPKTQQRFGELTTPWSARHSPPTPAPISPRWTRTAPHPAQSASSATASLAASPCAPLPQPPIASP